ncbi:MAG: hypothetical protein QGH40_08900 [bacterium]|nr:hypothetical protein [bacterium]
MKVGIFFHVIAVLLLTVALAFTPGPALTKPTVMHHTPVTAEFVFNTWSDPEKVILWDEDDPLSVGWYISGNIYFSGSAPSSGEYWDGVGYPNSPADFNTVRYQVVLEWDAFDSGGNPLNTRHREIIFGPKTLADVQNKRKIGSLPGEYSPKEEIWNFYIPLDEMELTFPVPNQCDIWPVYSDGSEQTFVAKSSLSSDVQDHLYRIYCEITYPYYRWSDDTPPRSRYIDEVPFKSEIRYALIKDVEPGAIDEELLKPFFEQDLTTDDPLREREIHCFVYDNNPNQEIESVVVNIGGDERPMKEFPNFIQRHYDKPSDFDGEENERYCSKWILDLDSPEAFGPDLPRAPNRSMETGPNEIPLEVEPLVVSVTATLKWGDNITASIEKSLKVRDNDAPGVTVILQPLDEKPQTITVSEGTFDPLQGRAEVLVQLSQPPKEYSPEYLEDPWPVFSDYLDLGGIFKGDLDSIIITEGKRTWISVVPRDNINGNQVKEIEMGSKASLTRLPFNPKTKMFENVIIFRNPDPEPQMYELILFDHSDNIRRIRFPVQVIDTRLDVYELESITKPDKK